MIRMHNAFILHGTFPACSRDKRASGCKWDVCVTRKCIINPIIFMFSSSEESSSWESLFSPSRVDFTKIRCNKGCVFCWQVRFTFSSVMFSKEDRAVIKKVRQTKLRWISYLQSLLAPYYWHFRWARYTVSPSSGTRKAWVWKFGMHFLNKMPNTYTKYGCSSWLGSRARGTQKSVQDFKDHGVYCVLGNR